MNVATAMKVSTYSEGVAGRCAVTTTARLLGTHAGLILWNFLFQFVYKLASYLILNDNFVEETVSLNCDTKVEKLAGQEMTEENAEDWEITRKTWTTIISTLSVNNLFSIKLDNPLLWVG